MVVHRTQKNQIDILKNELDRAIIDVRLKYNYLNEKINKIEAMNPVSKKTVGEYLKVNTEDPNPEPSHEKGNSDQGYSDIDSIISAFRNNEKNEEIENISYPEEEIDGLLNTVKMNSVNSIEFYKYPDGTVKQVLKDIAISIYEGQVWGVIGNNVFEIKLLLEIMANVKPYASGSCVLIERGMMKKKRKIVPHIFYIGSTEMLFYNMNVLEYLMFLTSKTGINPVDRQESFIDLLVETGLSHLTLVAIKELSQQEQAVILLIAAIFSESSKLIFFNFPHIFFDEKIQNSIVVIVSHIRMKNKTLIFSTQKLELIDKACTHSAIIVNGNIKFAGCIRRLYDELDKLSFIFKSDDAENVANKLKNELPEYHFEIIDGDIFMFNYDDRKINLKLIAAVLIKLEIEPEMIISSSKSAKNAYREAIKRYDN